MTIELLGDNCRKCQLLQNNIERALQSYDQAPRFQQVGEPERFASYGLLSLPGLAIDGKLMAEGRLLSVAEILAMLEA